MPTNPPPTAEGSEDPSRYCAFCGVDCYADPPEAQIYADDVEHAPDCPSVTGLFPVREDDVYQPGPPCDNCGHRNYIGMNCAECNAEINVGDHYMLQKTEHDNVFVIVCPGCGILTPTRAIDDDGQEGIAW